MFAILRFDPGAAINIVATALATGVVTLFTTWRAATRAVADELRKARNARGFDRRVRWYENARRDLRQFGAFGSTLMRLSDEARYRPGLVVVAENHRARVSQRIYEMILDAAVYASPQTVQVLANLERAVEEAGEAMYGFSERHAASTEELGISAEEAALLEEHRKRSEARASESVAAVHAALTLALNHVITETRELHGYVQLGEASLDISGALVDAILTAPKPTRKREDDRT